MKRINNKKQKINLFKNKFKKYLKKSIKVSKNLSFIILIFQSLFISSILITQPQGVNLYFMKLKRYALRSFDSFDIEDYGNYFKDLVFSFNPIKKDLQRLDLSLNFKNLQGLDCSRKYNHVSLINKEQLTIENCGKYWFKGKLTQNNESFNVKLRSKGDRKIHHNDFNTMSFKADIKGKDRLNGMEEFSIQTPIIRNYTIELFAAELMRKEGIIAPRNNYVKFYINGEYKGIRHIEESFSRELIEFNKRRYGPLFSLEESISKNFDSAFFDLSDAKSWNNNENQKYLAIQARTVLEDSKTKKHFSKNYFDLDIWAKYFAIIDAFRLWHGSLPKSVKFYLNPTTGLIEPAFFDGHIGAGPGLNNFNFFRLINIPNAYDKECEFFCDPKYSSFYKKFFGTYDEPNHEFYTKYIKHLKRITNDTYYEKNIMPIWQDLRDERSSLYKELWRKDMLSNPGLMPHIAPWKSLEKRIIKIQKNLERSQTLKPLIKVDELNNKIISISNKFSDIPQIIKLKCLDNQYETDNLAIGSNKKVNLLNNKINDCNINRIIYSINDVDYNNSVKNGYILESNQKINKPSISKKSINKNYKKDSLIFKKGDHNISSNLNLNNKNIIFEGGAKICLDKKQILHIKNSRLIFSENLESSVRIESCSKEIAGSIVIENSNLEINNLQVKNLSKPYLKLRSLDGGFNIINSDVDIKNFISINSLSEDAINFINSNVEATNIEINNSISDGVDSDFSKINIKKIKCNYIENDCFDSSFTEGNLDFITANNVKDKALSIGELSNLSIKEITVKDSEIGIVAKDASKLKIDNFYFENVKIPVASYIKKEEFGSPEILISEITPKSKMNFLISKDSVFKIGNVSQRTNINSEYIEGILYGNQFGVKTKR